MPRDIDFVYSMTMSQHTLLMLAVKPAVKFNGGILYMFVPQTLGASNSSPNRQTVETETKPELRYKPGLKFRYVIKEKYEA